MAKKNGALDLLIDQLLLDSKNPRIGSAVSQRDALQKIIDDQEEKLAELAEDISSEGMSPIERVLVLREKSGDGRFVVVEGNRRLAALKILSNPTALSGLSLKESLQRRLEAIAKEFKKTDVEPISCFEVSDRVEAKKWIYLRHTGENEGRGVVGWSGLAAARFRGTDPALQALEFVREHGNLKDHHKHLLDTSFPITTLDRLLSAKEVRKVLGVEVKTGRLCSGLPGDEIIKPLRRIVLDLAEKKINVSRLKNTAAQVEYVKSFQEDDSPDLSKKKGLRELSSFKNGEFSVQPPAASAAGKRKTYDPSERKTLIPRTLKLNITSTKVMEIYKELRTLWMEDNPHACAVLLRVFLELSVDNFLQLNGIDTRMKTDQGRHIDKSLKVKTKEAIDTLVEKKGCNRQDFNGVARALGDAGSPLHIELLHAYIHSQFQTPKTRDLRAAWDEAEPFFKQIWL